MNERTEKILAAIIREYIETVEPVSSRALVKNYNLDVSAATVRNEMYDLEEAGYIEKRHTSAGRIPSAKGYRYYVDSILPHHTIRQEDGAMLDNLWQLRSNDSVDFFRQMAKFMSQVTHNVSIFLAPTKDTAVIRYIHVLPIDRRQAIMVVVTSAGALDNESIAFNSPYSQEILEETASQLSNALRNMPLRDIKGATLQALLEEHVMDEFILRYLGDALLRALSRRSMLFTMGTPQLLAQPEFSDVGNVEPILHLMEEKEEVTRILSEDMDKPLTIRIGQENVDVKVQNCSIIQANFSGNKDHIGTIAILGPTRMDYQRMIGMFTYLQDLMKESEERGSS